MPSPPTYPGVYIEEIPGVRTIAGVSTSIAAFVDFFRRGPMDRAVPMFSMGDFEREFGGLDTRSEASYAIQQFFINGGEQAWVVRVPSGAPVKARGILQNAAGQTSLTIDAANEGIWGNRLRATIDYGTSDPATRFNLTISEVGAVAGRRVVVHEETFRNLSTDSDDPAFVRTIINNGSRLVTIVDPVAEERPLASGTLAAAHATLPVHPPTGGPIRMRVTFTIGGTARTEDVNLGTIPITTLEDAAARLEAGIRDANSGRPEWSQTTVRPVGGRLQVIAGPAAPDAIISFSAAPASVQFPPDPTSADSLRLTAAAGATENVAAYHIGSTISVGAQGAGEAGVDGDPPDAIALIGKKGVDPPTGMYALDKVPLFNILCLPRIARASGTPTDFPEDQVDAVVSAATAYCEQRRAFFIVDAPSNMTSVPQITDWLNTKATLRHRNLALYFPRVLVADPLNDFRLHSFGASGTVAGLYARTDATRGVWKAPAGAEAVLRNVSELECQMTDHESDILNRLAINSLRTFDVYGHVCLGARTLDGGAHQGSEWKYVPVRRLALFLEESLRRGTRWAVFEPNDEPLWAQIRFTVGAFMHSLFRQGAFQGPTPQQAYFVKCDAETTTQGDVDRGIMNIVVGFAPLKPAEFVIITIRQMAEPGQTVGVQPHRFDPYKNFRFRIRWDGRYVAGVSKVSVRGRPIEPVEHREGGDPGTTRRSPGRARYEAIRLERGVTHDTEFEKWVNKAWNRGTGRGEEASPAEFRKDIIIDVFNEAGQKVLAYRVYRCWVSEYQALPDLDSNVNAVAIQVLKLEHDGWERDYDVAEKTEGLWNS